MSELDILGLKQIGEKHDRYAHILYRYFKADMPQEKCDRCHQLADLYRYGTRNHSYRDLPTYQERTVLVVKRQRFWCRTCERPFVQKIPGFDSRRSMTTRCLNWIRANCLSFTFQHIARQIGCDLRTVRDIADERINELEREYSPYLPLWLGIDEIALDGRFSSSRCVLVDVEQRRPIDVLEDRKNKTLYNWLMAFKQSEAQLYGVTIDMNDHYRRTVRKVFPKAEIVADRFHIERWANRAVD